MKTTLTDEFKILKDLVNFNTIKDFQNKEILDYIERFLQELGFQTESKTKNLVMSIGKTQRLGFLGHTDTVEYIEAFQNPFQLTQKGEYLYGLGVCDMKGGIAGILDAISQINFRELDSGIKLYFTYDEEVGFGGIYELINHKEVFPETMIFGEPSDNEILTGSKGLLEYEVYFKGKKAHASNPLKGISANINAVKFLYELNEFYENYLQKETVDAFEIPYTTMNVGIINGGSAKNSIPANCMVSLDFRVVSKEHIPVIISKIEELSTKYQAESKMIEKVEPFYDEIAVLGKTKTANLITEASVILGCHQRIILGTGPVTAHEVNEHISIASYRKLVEQYKEIIYQMCGRRKE